MLPKAWRPNLPGPAGKLDCESGEVRGRHPDLFHQIPKTKTKYGTAATDGEAEKESKAVNVRAITPFYLL